MVSVCKNGVEYGTSDRSHSEAERATRYDLLWCFISVWNNVGGALYYGAGQNAFPLKKGLILHGGIRMAAVTAEHGLYYDTEWDVDLLATSDGRSKTILMSVVDTAERRPPPEELAVGQFTLMDQPNVPMSK